MDAASKVWGDAGTAATALSGASTPIAKPLLEGPSPQLLAGLLYLGSGIGVGTVWLVLDAVIASMTAEGAENMALRDGHDVVATGDDPIELGPQHRELRELGVHLHQVCVGNPVHVGA